MACGDVTVALHIFPEGSERGLTQAPTLNLRVDELEPAVEKVVKAGGTLLEIREAEPDIPVRLAELKDTEGNMFEFRQPV
jgi:predicted enzyme related to lactoylglutathione lyase